MSTMMLCALRRQLSLRKKTTVLRFLGIKSTRTLIIIGCCTLAHMSGYGQSGSCQECAITSFASVTVYEIFQSGSSLGFGMEAGTWSKKGSRFSLFLGTSMQWFHQASSLDKEDNSGDKTRFTTYLKGQFEVFHRFYVVAAPEFVNLTSFEGSVGVRYIVPVTKFLGLGIEPAYLVVQKQYTLSANIHFALR